MYLLFRLFIIKSRIWFNNISVYTLIINFILYVFKSVYFDINFKKKIVLDIPTY